MITNGVFGRENELAAIRQRLSKRRSFLLHGLSGIGKTSLVREAIREHPEVLYCSASAGKQVVLRTLAAALLEQSGVARRKLGGPDGVKTKSAISLKGIVLEALRTGRFWIVLDHLSMPSQAFAAEVKEMAGWGTTPILGIARSDHMEDVGFLMPLFSDRSDKMELRPLEEAVAVQLVEKAVAETGLIADNLSEFVARVMELSRGNPGVIRSMVKMAGLSKYRTGSQIMVTPLYIDLRLSWQTAGARS
jgi:hypothetical protein